MSSVSRKAESVKAVCLMSYMSNTKGHSQASLIK